MQQDDGTFSKLYGDDELIHFQKVLDETGAPPIGGVFIGQTIEIQGHPFRVRKITRRDIIVRGPRLPFRFVITGEAVEHNGLRLKVRKMNQKDVWLRGVGE